MKVLYFSKVLVVLIISIQGFSQESQPVSKGVILAVEEENVFLDLNQTNVTVGSRFQVIKDQGFFVHPVTGEQIQRNPQIVAYIEITEVHSNYSTGAVSPRGASAYLESGMEAYLMEGDRREISNFRKSIAVQPMNVSSARGGYLGFYIADLLTEELFNVDKFKVIDRQTLGLQMDEIALTSQGLIDEREAVTIGRTKGVDYFITGTVYEPDVIETSTGIPIKGILSVAEGLSGVSLGSNLASDVKVSQLRSIVNITLRVVDVETGEILFIASEMQQAVGRSQIDLEQGALGGLQLQGGATSFLNTITGQATRAALVNLAGYIEDYFDGKIDARNFRGNIIDIGKAGTRSDRRNTTGTRSDRRNTRGELENAQIIFSEFIEYQRFGIIGNHTEQVFSVIIDRGSSAGYRRRVEYSVYEPRRIESQISEDTYSDGFILIGLINLTTVEPTTSQGRLVIEPHYHKPEDYSFDEAIVVKRGRLR